MTKECLVCDETFPKTETQSVKTWNTVVKYCSKPCQIIGVGRVAGPRIAALNKSRSGVPLTETAKAKLRIARVGKTPALGMRHTQDAKDRIRKSTLDAQTTDVRLRKSLSHRGDENWNWKGGRTELKHQIRTGYLYRKWRSDVFTRDRFTCIWCGDSRGGNLAADHIVQLTDILDTHHIVTLEEADECDALWNIDNGRTLCANCHTERHKNYQVN